MKPAAPALPRTTRHWMLATATLTLLPHLFFVRPWLGALASVLLLWHGLRIGRTDAPPMRLAIVLLAFAAGGAILFSFGTLFGKEAGVALLILLLSLKLIESRAPRDAQVLVLLCFFLQLALFLDTESALTGLGALAGALLASATLASLHFRAPPARQLRLAATLLAQALPFMVVLFLLFPRIPGPLWGLPADAYGGLTGLSDSMAPGSISQLSQSAEIAFRARFDGPIPARAQLYWRGPVLSHFDGRRWTDARTAARDQPAYAASGPAVRYELTLEPHNRPWMLALDFPGAGIPEALYTSDFQVIRRQPVRHRLRYAASAYPTAQVGIDELPRTLRLALDMPAQSNPRTQALGRELARGASDTAAIVAAGIAWMRSADLAYTLEPPLLGAHTSDEFLFDTRRGFCEHFANSFALLMRAAGVPARVVTGYQGGEANPYDGSLIVRQSDAHAWTEVWLPGRGWQRVDPTAASAPRRIDGGLAAALPEGEPVPYLVATDMAWLRMARDRWEFFGNAWNQWVLGYDEQRQRDLLRRVGLSDTDWTELAATLLGACTVLFALLLWWAHRQRPQHDALARQWLRFERRLARRGLPRLPSEGPADYAMRASRALPRHAGAIEGIARRYTQLRYGRTAPDANDIRALRSDIDRFRNQCH
jgi:transglutaminase-like putative cysteine protease